MIDPIERRSPFFATLRPTSLYAVLANVDADGKLWHGDDITPKGNVIFLPEEQCESLASNLWIVRDGEPHVPSGMTLQTFAPGNHLAEEIGGNPELNPWHKHLGIPKLVVSAFTSGITGADRAMEQALTDELGDIDYMHALSALSNDALAHALYTDLREQVSLEEHHANINELEGFSAASTNDVGDEIRDFLSAMRNPKDKIGRYNVYRKVLIVRAIQRRARGIVATKQDRVKEIVAAQNATAMYISDVDALARRAESVLADKQPWWTNGDTGILPHVSRPLRRKFASRLRGYVDNLDFIFAYPFLPWAMLAAKHMNAMAEDLEDNNCHEVGINAMMARRYLQTLRVQERVSRGIVSMRQNDSSSTAHDAFSSAIAWSLETAPHLHLPNTHIRTMIRKGQLGQRTTSNTRRIEALRAVEIELMTIGIAKVA